MEKIKLPFSKATIIAARYESYVIAALLFLFVWFDKDVSSIAILASLSWGGYRIVQNFYIWMAKHEHIMDKKIEYRKYELDTETIDEEARTIEQEDISDSENYYG